MIIQPLADLHGHLPNVPPCDLFLLGGDLCPVEDHSPEFQMRWLRGEFASWLDGVPAEKKIWIAGNHDFITQANKWPELAARDIPGEYLQDSGTSWEGVHIWGTPWINTIGLGPNDWAWETDEEGMQKRFDLVPESVDILLSHGPAYGYGDQCRNGMRVGSESMFQAVERIRPRLVVSGHIHEDPGFRRWENTSFHSVSLLDGNFKERSSLPAQLHWQNGEVEIIES